jgi:hypothetical protein
MAMIWFDYPVLVARITFTKGPEVLVVEYRDSLEIVLKYGGAASQALRFSDPATAAFCQIDLERELLAAGWSVDISELNSPGSASVNAFEMSERGTTRAH